MPIKKNVEYKPINLVFGKNNKIEVTNSVTGKIHATQTLPLPISGEVPNTALKLPKSKNLLSAVYVNKKINNDAMK